MLQIYNIKSSYKNYSIKVTLYWHLFTIFCINICPISALKKNWTGIYRVVGS